MMPFELNDQQRKAVEPKNGLFVVCAGAGSGKTRVITSRIINLMHTHAVEPGAIIALTFTNKAAKEMLHRVTASNEGPSPFIGTFHSYCLNLLKTHRDASRIPNFAIIDEDDQERLVKSIINTYGLGKQCAPRTVLSTLSLIKNGLTSGSLHKELQQLSDPFMRDLITRYEKEKTACCSYDFDDLLLEALHMLKQHPEIALQHQQHIRHILVDEYQDTNRLQHELLKQMALNHKDQFALDSLCVVGDEDQSIYSWRGATIDNILHVQKEFGGGMHVTIDQNYRSTQHILSCANALITHNQNRHPKKLWSARDGRDRVRMVELQSGYQEADTIAACIRALRQTKPQASIAVLYRSHHQSRLIEEALIKQGVGYTIIGNIQFYKRQEIKDLLAYARVAINPFDRVSFSRILNTPPRGLGEKSENALLSLWQNNPFTPCTDLAAQAQENQTLNDTKLRALERLVATIKSINPDEHPSAALAIILNETNYLTYLAEHYDEDEAETKTQNVQEFVGSLASVEFAQTTLRSFLEHIALVEELSAAQNRTQQSSVKLMTFHAAKGLEFDCVILPGLEEQILPASRSLYAQETLEEERRLLYVGITRAKEYVLMLYSTSRLLFGSLNTQKPSRFIAEIPKDLASRESAHSWTPWTREQFFARWFDTNLFDTNGFGSSMFGSSELAPPQINPKKEALRMQQTRTKKQPVQRVEKTTLNAGTQPFKKFDAVTHETFGVGIVDMVEQKPNGTLHLTIRFGMGTKTIAAQFVKKI